MSFPVQESTSGITISGRSAKSGGPSTFGVELQPWWTTLPLWHLHWFVSVLLFYLNQSFIGHPCISQLLGFFHLSYRLCWPPAVALVSFGHVDVVVVFVVISVVLWLCSYSLSMITLAFRLIVSGYSNPVSVYRASFVMHCGTISVLFMKLSIIM